jgi:hypothetical protein
MRTYGSRLSILSATLSLLWIQGLTTFYLTLALVYGNFTWYFLWPTLLLSLMSCIYLQQIVATLLKMRMICNSDNFAQQYIFKLYFLVYMLVIPLVYYFEEILLSNLWTTLLSGCIWIPQILKNAAHGNRNTLKMRHAILMQASISWLTVYLKVNATSVFNLKPQDNFVIFYVSLISTQIWAMFIQKWWSPRIIIPDRLMQFLIEEKATFFRYKTSFYAYQQEQVTKIRAKLTEKFNQLKQTHMFTNAYEEQKIKRRLDAMA